AGLTRRQGIRLGVRREPSTELSRQRLFAGRGVEAARPRAARRIGHLLPFELGLRSDQVLDAFRVLDARKLQDDPVGDPPADSSLAVDDGLGDAEGIDAVADRLERRADRAVLDL